MSYIIRVIKLILCLLGISFCFGQDTLWHALPNAPEAPAELKKHDDIYFRNDTTGWLVTRSGQIFYTSDGGTSWLEQMHDSTAFLRCIGFLDDFNGIAGNLKADTSGKILYRTENKGLSWNVVDSSAISGEIPKGMCGIFVVDSSTVYACGRVFGPAFFIRSFDGGDTWESFNMSDSVGMLIDLYFWDVNHGIMIGGSDTDTDSCRMLILYTENAGDSWETVYLGDRVQEWGWKISFPSETIGYVSIQKLPFTDATTEYFLKTTDGGMNWIELAFMYPDSTDSLVYSSQGIGFVTPTKGWLGSYGDDKPTLVTEDGGVTWAEATFGQYVNRIRFLHLWLGYATGRMVYKYVDSTAMSISDQNMAIDNFSLSHNYPNPFNPKTVIPYEIMVSGPISIAIIDITGKHVRSLINEHKSPGTYTVKWNGKNNYGDNVATGTYFCIMTAGNLTTSQKILLLR